MKNDVFTLDRYGEKPVFSSFLPGIAGERGIPVWCYYNNRGQAVCSFGIQDKDHAIMEFSPAHVAYQTVRQRGFRTFVRRGGQVIEAFADESAAMDIRPNELSLRWQDGQTAVEVAYFVLPACKVGALARVVRLTNLGPAEDFTLLDGMSALVPYGVSQDALKNMTQLAKAWMQVEDAALGLPFFRVRASMADTAVVTPVEGGNFALGLNEQGARLPVVVDPEAIFDYDTALARPLGFMSADFAARVQRQSTQNLFPCAFFTRSARLQPHESVTIYELYGQAQSKAIFHQFAEQKMDAGWFRQKQSAARALTDQMTDAIRTVSADPVFDAYCRQTYLDNLLRGGEPIRFKAGNQQNIFYLYSRKHGDPEREYNYFVMSPEYYSQGNGNFRDVCQNRRCDVQFHPWVGDANIRLFFSLLQSDGYNPLVIDRMTFRAADAPAALQHVSEESRPAAQALLSGEFTPGALTMAAEGWRFVDTDAAAFTADILAHAAAQPNATFVEGYWCDHWTYSLDLIESYLAVWPEKKQELLFGAADYPWYETRALVLPYAQRCEQTPAGLRQTRFLDLARKAHTAQKWMREQGGAGDIAQNTLIEKMVFLCAIKYATLDKAGIGVEMEGGKPGWYDALNGLPALFGSSVAESCELARLLQFTADALAESGQSIALYDEMANLLRDLSRLPQEPLSRWQQANALREHYREITAEGVQGSKTALPAGEVANILRAFLQNVQEGLSRAVAIGGGICPTYLMFPNGKPEALPLFLEGPVRWLKLNASLTEKRRMTERIKNSGLYDSKLRMYKVNENLSHLTYAAGRTRAFTPGWLENESVWLHMEYKYLLELLRSGLYDAFEQAFSDAAIPFLDPAVYGRSTYENVSFIASSANPNPALHGRGFVARLSGSTVEFLSIWQLMLFGPAPFRLENGSLTLRFEPMLLSRIIPKNGPLEAAFLGQCRVRYWLSGQESLVPGRYTIQKYVLDGKTYPCDCLPAPAAQKVRSGEIRQIDVYIHRT